jgi:hypothetical protein
LKHVGFVHHRDQDGRAAGVELAEVGDRRVVSGGHPSIAEDRGGIPGAELSGRVVERSEPDAERGALGKGETLAPHDVARLAGVGADEGHARVDRQRGRVRRRAAEQRGDETDDKEAPSRHACGPTAP